MSVPVGTVVELKVNCLGNIPKTKGVCFNDYETGSQFIFENGEYDGFSDDEIKDFLNIIDFSYELESYEFYNVMVVSNDYRNGKFDSVLKHN
jgi:hypothetical protein